MRAIAGADESGQSAEDGAVNIGWKRDRFTAGNIRKRALHAAVSTLRRKHNWRYAMLKFLGSTVGIIFLIGLIVVIALFKLVF